MLDLGLHGFALSRYCGLWTAFKVVANVADESGTVEVGADRVQPILPSFEVDVQRRWPSVEKAERLLGWRARIGVREGIEATARWMAGRL